eukprot:3331115-Rhodomonas_salina.1
MKTGRTSPSNLRRAAFERGARLLLKANRVSIKIPRVESDASTFRVDSFQRRASSASSRMTINRELARNWIVHCDPRERFPSRSAGCSTRKQQTHLLVSDAPGAPRLSFSSTWPNGGD